MRTPEKIIKQKRRLFNTLLAKTHQMSAKQYILEGQGVNSTTELSEKQLDWLIDWASDILANKRTDADRDVREWRHKCLRMIALCGVDTQDWNKVNAFMLNKRICGKHLYELTTEELMTLHRKLHNVAANIDKKVTMERRQAYLN